MMKMYCFFSERRKKSLPQKAHTIDYLPIACEYDISEINVACKGNMTSPVLNSPSHCAKNPFVV